MDYVYLWADGINVNIRLEEHKLCLLVHDRGARRQPQGTRRADRRLPGIDRVLGGPAARLLHGAGCERRCSPIGDGALGFWGALREVFPATPGAEMLVPLCRHPDYADLRLIGAGQPGSAGP